jgi:hypothetical protein
MATESTARPPKNLAVLVILSRAALSGGYVLTLSSGNAAVASVAATNTVLCNGPQRIVILGLDDDLGRLFGEVLGSTQLFDKSTPMLPLSQGTWDV